MFYYLILLLAVVSKSQDDCFSNLCFHGFNDINSFIINGQWSFIGSDDIFDLPIYESTRSPGSLFEPTNTSSRVYQISSSGQIIDYVLFDEALDSNSTCSSTIADALTGLTTSSFSYGPFDAMTCSDFFERDCNNFSFEDEFCVDLVGSMTDFNGQYTFSGCSNGLPTYINSDNNLYEMRYNWNQSIYETVALFDTLYSNDIFGLCWTGLYSFTDCYADLVFVSPDGYFASNSTVYQEQDVLITDCESQSVCVTMNSATEFYEMIRDDGSSVGGFSGKYLPNGTLNGHNMWSRPRSISLADIWFENNEWIIGTSDDSAIQFRCSDLLDGVTDLEQLTYCTEQGSWQTEDLVYLDLLVDDCSVYSGSECVIGDTDPASKIMVSGFDTSSDYALLNGNYTLLFCSNGYPYYSGEVDSGYIDFFMFWTVGVPMFYADINNIQVQVKCNGYDLLECPEWILADNTELTTVVITQIETETVTTVSPVTTAAPDTTSSGVTQIPVSTQNTGGSDTTIAPGTTSEGATSSPDTTVNSPETTNNGLMFNSSGINSILCLLFVFCVFY